MSDRRGIHIENSSRPVRPGVSLRWALVLSSFIGGSVAAGFLVHALGTCARAWPQWLFALDAATWANVILDLVVLGGVALLACVAISWVIRGVRGTRWLASISAFSLGAATWLLPAVILVESASYLGRGICSVNSFGPIFLFECGVACVGISTITALIIMAIVSAWRRPRPAE